MFLLLHHDYDYLAIQRKVDFQQTFPVMGQLVKNLGFVEQMVSVTTTQFCHCSMKAATDNIQMNEGGFFPIKCYSQEQMVGWIWPKGPSFLTSAPGKESQLYVPTWQLCLVFLLI